MATGDNALALGTTSDALAVNPDSQYAELKKSLLSRGIELPSGIVAQTPAASRLDDA